ncbi:MMPL family transporter [Actinoallomurus purpureus]|uniref:MMPL family transporter n=1 Tax=Actinoallomurus purpureus TaxID=478114 RepID=UPI0020937D89|nr:MMPL family transporter [Actinoallomurus purpureus]MCO6006505.1 MMPL family transporter [Actinoallomurus purpureus]
MYDGPLARLARFCHRRRRLVLAAWIVGAAIIIAVGFSFAAPADNDFSGGKSESSRAQELIKQHFPGQNGDTLTLAIRADGGVQAVRSRVEKVLGDLAHTPHVVSVSSPYQAPGQVSPDQRTAFAPVQLDKVSDDMPVKDVTAMISDVRKASGDGLALALGGSAVINAETPGGGPTEGIGLLAAVIVLLIAFGSLLAMGLPIVTAVFGIGTGLAGIGLLGHLLPAPGFSPIVAGLIGLGVGIDYALFIVTRYREALSEDGADPEHATVVAIATAGRSVLFAGTTVVVALMGLFVMGQRLLNAVAVAASLTVLMTMVTAITLLPALLGFTGRNIDRFGLRLLTRRRARRPLSERWAGVIQRRPVLALATSAIALLTLAVPTLSMRLSFTDSSTQPHDTSAYASHRILADGFGAGYDAPLVVVARPPGDARPVADAVRSTPGVASVTPVRTSRDGTTAMFVAYPKTGLQDAATPRLVHTLRAAMAARRDAGGPQVYVGGPNAGTIDFADAVTSRLVLLIAVVVGLSLLLLLVLVRSVAIAIKAALMNLLSIGAAYGVLTAVVQWGWLGRQLGFPTGMPVTAWVPLFMFPILFGLSMDYEVFLISRVREEYDAGVATREAVTRGLARTARVITAAAAIMVCVFLSVLLGADIAVKQMGLGLGVAVLIDATVVRMVLVPAVMELLGGANWWLPGWLARLLPAAEPATAAPRVPVRAE